jgi:hypothetical protein
MTGLVAPELSSAMQRTQRRFNISMKMNWMCQVKIQPHQQLLCQPPHLLHNPALSLLWWPLQNPLPPLQIFLLKLSIFSVSLLSKVEKESRRNTVVKVCQRPCQWQINTAEQNLQQEFATTLKKGEELPLKELGSALASGFNGGLEEFLKFQAEQEQFATQHIELYMHYLGCAVRAGKVAFDQEKAMLLLRQNWVASPESVVICILMVSNHGLTLQKLDTLWNWA